MAAIVVRDEQGRRVVSDAMGYDKLLVLDHLRHIDAVTVLGAMDRKGDAFPLYF